MIMPRGQQLLLPVNPAFIAVSLLIGLAINLVPLGRWVWLPDLLMVLIVFWGVHQPLRTGMGVAFALGLCMDVGQSALLGQHALVYTVLSYSAIAMHRRLLWFSGALAGRADPALVCGCARRFAAGAVDGGGGLSGVVLVHRAADRVRALAAGVHRVAGAAAARTRPRQEPAAVTGLARCVPP